MAAFNKFHPFVEALAEKLHDLGNDQLAVALTNTAPNAANSQLSDITEIDYTNLSSRLVTTVSSAQTGGTYKLTLADLNLLASGGSVGPFRYVVLYNDDALNDEVIGWYDRGESITLADGEDIDIDFDDVNGVFTLA